MNTNQANFETFAQLATEGRLPRGFNQWGISGGLKGLTVAHVALLNGTLPADFDQWHLTDGFGKTVAHYAIDPVIGASRTANADLPAGSLAKSFLPRGFTQWHLADESGWTVAHAAALRGLLPADFDQWDLTDVGGETVADVAARSKKAA